MSGAHLDARDSQGNTALLYAAAKGYFPIVDFLLSKGARANLSNKSLVTPLMVARNPEIARRLLQNRANINAASLHGETALMTAIRAQKIVLVKFLIRNGAALNTKNENNEDALSIAQMNGNIEIINLLKSQGKQ